MRPDGYQDLTQEQFYKLCEENLAELRELRIQKANQVYQWRPVEYECKACGNSGCVEAPHYLWAIGVLEPVPGLTEQAVADDHSEKCPECERMRIEFERWRAR